MTITDAQHSDWYIAFLLPHLRVPLSQQKIGTQVEAVDITMRLEASLVQDTNVGYNRFNRSWQVCKWNCRA